MRACSSQEQIQLKAARRRQVDRLLMSKCPKWQVGSEEVHIGLAARVGPAPPRSPVTSHRIATKSSADDSAIVRQWPVAALTSVGRRESRLGVWTDPLGGGGNH